MSIEIKPQGDLAPLKDPAPNDRFCGSRCGRGCTHAEYKAACDMAAVLANQLPAGFEPYVWENLGWHYKAIFKRNGDNFISIYPQKSRSFWADSRIAGRQFHITRDHAKEALKDLLHEIDATTNSERACFEVFKERCE